VSDDTRTMVVVVDSEDRPFIDAMALEMWCRDAAKIAHDHGEHYAERLMTQLANDLARTCADPREVSR
jgi:hypothetical protein